MATVNAYEAKAKLSDDKGVAIFAVAPGGPADKAGLQSGDIILAFEGENIDRDTRLQWLASTAGVGKTVNLRVWRQGKAFDLKVTLGELPSMAALAGPTQRSAPE